MIMLNLNAPVGSYQKRINAYAQAYNMSLESVLTLDQDSEIDLDNLPTVTGMRIIRVETTAANWGFLIGLSGWIWFVFFANISRFRGYHISFYEHTIASMPGNEPLFWVMTGILSILAGTAVGLIFHLVAGHKNVVVSQSQP